MAQAGLLFVGTDDGVVLLSNPGAIGRWLKIGHGLRGQVVRAVWPLVDTPLVVFAAVAWAGLQRSDDGGQTWRMVFDAEVAVITGHHRVSRVLYLRTVEGVVYRSVDAGGCWSRCTMGMPESAVCGGFIVSRADPDCLYCQVDDGVLMSRDAGAHWLLYGGGLHGVGAGVCESPGTAGVLYAVVDGGVWRCDGPDAVWGMLMPTPGGVLAMLPGHEEVLLRAVSSAAGLVRSSDQGVLWMPVDVGFSWSGEVTTIVPARYHIDTVFVGSSGGQVAISGDRGRRWLVLRDDLAAIRHIASARLL